MNIVVIQNGQTHSVKSARVPGGHSSQTPFSLTISGETQKGYSHDFLSVDGAVKSAQSSQVPFS